ncbi:hypothetical protein RHMOL_Rhmol01G0025200 [Rhododendron molle]|uniref:Uncharacterized protein n=1 Tax=Rhododendron molle TaxID=49168 RepID=A0ACC0PX31_RHOML|nr:hypothetical protein RHMOL_Rhmol01G0025200 [Rhododendron molle]
MDNHQSKLAEELADRKHLFCASPQTLLCTINSMILESLIPYHPGDARPVPGVSTYQMIDQAAELSYTWVRYFANVCFTGQW